MTSLSHAANQVQFLSSDNTEKTWEKENAEHPDAGAGSGNADAEMYKSEYGSWRNAKNRAKVRGIEFDPRFDAFSSFFALMGPKSAPTDSLDRIDSSGAYSPENCRWASKKTQSSNRANVELVDYQGERLTIAELARRQGKTPQALYARRKRHGSVSLSSPGTIGKPWPADKEAVWEEIYLANMEPGEDRVDFYFRISAARYRAVGVKFLGPPGESIEPGELSDDLHAEYEKQELKWRIQLDRARRIRGERDAKLLAKRRRERARAANAGTERQAQEMKDELGL